MTSTENVSDRLSDDAEGKTRRAEWDLELWGELHRLTDLNYATAAVS